MSQFPDDHIESYKTPFLDQAGKKCVFYVPDNYFLTLESRILEGVIKAENDLSLFNLANSEYISPTQFIEPDEETAGNAYFENLSHRISDRIEAVRFDVTRSITDLPRTDPFIVPEGYFKKLPLLINQLIYLRQEQVISILKPGTRGSSKIFQLSRIAAAASIALVALFTGLHYQSLIKSTNEYAKTATEERFNYRYDIDESLVEDELIGQPVTEIESANPIIKGADSSAAERYLLDHLDTKTLIEEI